MHSETIILIESEDDSIYVKNIKQFEEYTSIMFKNLTNGHTNIPELYDPRQIPNLLSVGDYFLIKNESEEKLVFTLYVIFEKEKGWITSYKVKRGREVKSIIGKRIEMFSPVINGNINVDDDGCIISGKINDAESDFAKILESLPKNWKDDESCRNFVNKMCTIDESTKQKIIDNLKPKLDLVEMTYGRENKIKMILDIYNTLAEPEGMQFIYANFRFYKICRAKIIEFYNKEDVKQLGPLYEKIFGSKIPTSN